MVKKEFIDNYMESRRKEAQDIFQGEVNAILSEIANYTARLKKAKERLAALEYVEPVDLDI